MTPLVPLALFGWLPLSMILFASLPAHRAAMVVVVVGMLFLPHAGYEVPVLSSYGKSAAISIGLLLGSLLARDDGGSRFQFTVYDLPIVAWCFLAPIGSSIANDLGIRDGVARSLTAVMEWGVVYWAGRRFFRTGQHVKELAIAIVAGGLVYVPLGLFEVRMSPQLSNMFYGFRPGSFLQAVRYGGYRPIVFMRHGLMVALWFAVSYTVAIWLWKTRTVSRVLRVGMGVVVVALFTIGVLSKSVNGWFFLLAGTFSIYYFRRTGSVSLFRIGMLVVPAYIVLRLANAISVEHLTGLVAQLLDDDRVASLTIRLVQENLFGEKALQRPWFGWGWMGRAWPVDIATGNLAVPMVDSLFVITLGTSGLVGLVSLYAAMLTPPWKVLTSYAKGQAGIRRSIARLGPAPIALSLVVAFFLVDSLLNAMLNQIYVLTAGSLLSFWQFSEEEATSPEETEDSPALVEHTR